MDGRSDCQKESDGTDEGTDRGKDDLTVSDKKAHGLLIVMGRKRMRVDGVPHLANSLD